MKHFIYIALSLTLLVGCATKNNGAGTNRTLPAPLSVWHNYDNAFDVNGSGFVSAVDILDVINLMNRLGERLIEPGPAMGPGRYDVNLDGYVTTIDGELVAREYNNLGPTGSGPTFISSDPQTRRLELGRETIDLFYRLCPIEPVDTIEGKVPSLGQRWFRSKSADSNGDHVYFSVWPLGDFVRLAPGSISREDKYIANLPMELFIGTDDPFARRESEIMDKNPYECPK